MAAILTPKAAATPTRRGGGFQGATLAVAGFLPILSILSLAPAVPTLIAHFRSVPNAGFIVPLLATTPGLMVALLSPLAGWTADRYGRRVPLLLATSIYAFAGTAPMLFPQLWAVLLSRICVGVSETFVLVIVNALYADYFKGPQRRTWITVQGLLGPALGAASIVAAGMLANLQWNAVFLIYILALPVFLAVAVWCFEPERASLEPANQKSKQLSLSLVAIYCSITVFASTIYYVYVVQGGLAFQAVGVRSPSKLGAIMSLLSLGVIPGALFFNFMSRHWNGDRIAAAFLALLGLGTAGVGYSSTIGVASMFSFIQEVGAGMTVSGLIFWVSRLLPPDHRGRGFGYWTSAFFMAQFISPVVVELVATSAGGVLAAFRILGVISLIGSGAILALSPRMPQALEPEHV